MSFSAVLAAPMAASAQVTSLAAITSPVPGQILQAAVSITGTAYAPGFASAELDFAYAEDTTDTWFRIQVIDQPVRSAVLASWDTMTISDGDYILRLRVDALDGTSQEAKVSVQVRNYTAAPVPLPSSTASPTPALPIPTPMVVTPLPTATPLPPPTPSPFPPNPAGTTTAAIYVSFWKGALIVAGLFIVVLLFRRLS
jgi:hypothetical protein